MGLHIGITGWVRQGALLGYFAHMHAPAVDAACDNDFIQSALAAGTDAVLNHAGSGSACMIFRLHRLHEKLQPFLGRVGCFRGRCWFVAASTCAAWLCWCVGLEAW